MVDRRIRIAISSDRRLFAESLAASLEHEPGLEVVGHVVEAALPGLSHHSPPDILLLDVGIDVDASLGALERFHQRCAEVRTIVVYDRLTAGEMARARRAGASALVPAGRALDLLLQVLRRLVDRTGDGAESPLSNREHKIIAMVAAGYTATAIAELMHVTPTAVENTKRRIYRKLGVGCQSEAIARMVGLGLLDRARGPAPQPADDGKLLVVLRGSDPITRRAVLTALLRSHVAVQQELLPRRTGVPYDEAQRGSVVLVLLDPDATDWLGAGENGLPIVLVHTAKRRRARLTDLLLHSVHAVLTVDRIRDDLLPVLAVVARGYVTLEAGEAHSLFNLQPGPAGGAGPPDLTPRETEILRSIARGHTVRQTARALGIAIKTVENTQARLFRKLGTHSRGGTLSVAHSLGLIESLDSAEAGTTGAAPPAIGAVRDRLRDPGRAALEPDECGISISRWSAADGTYPILR